MVEKAKKRPGRPRKPPAERSETFSIRLVPELRARLEQAAAESGRSMTAEIVQRLAGSFNSLKTVMLANRFMELELVDREIDAQVNYLHAVSNDEALDLQEAASAKAALIDLRYHKDVILMQITELTKSLSTPDSVHAKREMEPASDRRKKTK